MRRSIFFVVVIFLLRVLIHDLDGQTDYFQNQSQQGENDHEKIQNFCQIQTISLPSPSRRREVFFKKVSLPEPLLRSMYRKNQRFGQESMTTGRYDQRLIFSITYFSTQYNKKPPVLRIPGASCFSAWGMPYSRFRSR